MHLQITAQLLRQHRLLKHCIYNHCLVELKHCVNCVTCTWILKQFMPSMNMKHAIIIVHVAYSHMQKLNLHQQGNYRCVWCVCVCDHKLHFFPLLARSCHTLVGHPFHCSLLLVCQLEICRLHWDET